MGLAHRVIPTILCNGRKLVKGKQFNAWRTVGVASQAVRIHAARGVDEVVLLDIGATPQGRGPDLSLVEELAEMLFVPLAVGGGIRNLNDARALLRAGADKVVLGKALRDDPMVARQISDVVGRQAVVAALDVIGGTVPDLNFRYPVVAEDWAVELEEHGVGEIILTSMDREGTMLGYDLDVVRKVRAVTSVPLVAHGGCSGYEDMAQAIRAGASAVAAGALFQFTEATPKGAAAYLQEHGIEARV